VPLDTVNPGKPQDEGAEKLDFSRPDAIPDGRRTTFCTRRSRAAPAPPTVRFGIATRVDTDTDEDD
jgi:hypothetical protein